MKKIYCFGNPYIKEDSIALELADILNADKELNKRFQFIKCTSPDFLLNEDVPDELIIIDVVKGIDEVKVMHDIENLRLSKSTTVHDFDLGNTLKLLKSRGYLKKVIIIALPYAKEANKKQVISLLSLNIPF
jgi:Ni,Fe-hydrogenase maturation factor